MLTLLPALLWARDGLSRYRGRNRVLLIGKDGHVAFEAASPLAPADITGRIDRMPRRRDEMRRRGKR